MTLLILKDDIFSKNLKYLRLKNQLSKEPWGRFSWL